MEIREAKNDDIFEILNVLKDSLGEKSSKKNEEVWKFKHEKNPFGKSLVLLAIVDEKIVGIRAFMKWQWQIGDITYKAFRAVDTATHPNYQGRGIFKKLTLKALEIAKQLGYHFVFNTPNDKSRPGYLKMGWKPVDKLRIKLIANNPIYWNKSRNFEALTNNHTSSIHLENLLKAHNLRSKQNLGLYTPKSLDYWRWRYEENPLQNYYCEYSNDYIFATYVKRHSKYSELRISELITENKIGEKEALKKAKSLARKFGVNFITIASRESSLFNPLIGKFGPILTLKNINLRENENLELQNLNNWNYSLGDLELF